MGAFQQAALCNIGMLLRVAELAQSLDHHRIIELKNHAESELF